MSNQTLQIDFPGIVELLVAVFKQARRDAQRGEQEAIQFLDYFRRGQDYDRDSNQTTSDRIARTV